MTARFTPCVKAVAAALCLLMTAGDAALCAEAAGLSAGVPASVSAGTPVSGASFRAPLDHAIVKSTHDGTNGKLVIHIQDAHANPGAQRHLAAALESLMLERGIDLILVEGASVDVSLGRIRDEHDPAVLERVASRFLREGKIAGEEYLNLTSDLPMRLAGIEDRALYDEALAAYRDLASFRPQALAYVRKLRVAADRLKTVHYPRELVRYERAKLSPGSRFSESLSQLEELALAAGVLTERYDELRRFAGLARSGADASGFTAADAARLMTQAQSLEDAVYASMVRGEDARLLRECDKHVALLEDAHAIAISSGRLAELRRTRGDFGTERVAAFLNRLLVEAGAGEAVVAHSDALDRARPALDRFYGLTAKRDEAFVRNAAREMAGEDAAVLIAGGYHTDNLLGLLQKQGYSTVVLAPYVEEATDGRDYEKVLFETAEASTLRGAAVAEPAAAGGPSGSRVRFRELVEAIVGAAHGAGRTALRPKRVRDIEMMLLSHSAPEKEKGFAALEKAGDPADLGMILGKFTHHVISSSGKEFNRYFPTAVRLARSYVMANGEQALPFFVKVALDSARDLTDPRSGSQLSLYFESMRFLTGEQRAQWLSAVISDADETTRPHRMRLIGRAVDRQILDGNDLIGVVADADPQHRPGLIHSLGVALERIRIRSAEERVRVEKELFRLAGDPELAFGMSEGRVRFAGRRVRLFESRARVFSSKAARLIPGTPGDEKVLALFPSGKQSGKLEVLSAHDSFMAIALDNIAYARFRFVEMDGKRTLLVTNMQSDTYKEQAEKGSGAPYADWMWQLRLALEYVARSAPADARGRLIERIAMPTGASVFERWPGSHSEQFMRFVYDAEAGTFGYEREYLDAEYEWFPGFKTDVMWVKKIAPGDIEEKQIDAAIPLSDQIASGSRTSRNADLRMMARLLREKAARDRDMILSTIQSRIVRPLDQESMRLKDSPFLAKTLFKMMLGDHDASLRRKAVSVAFHISRERRESVIGMLIDALPDSSDKGRVAAPLAALAGNINDKALTRRALNAIVTHAGGDVLFNPADRAYEEFAEAVDSLTDEDKSYFILDISSKFRFELALAGTYQADTAFYQRSSLLGTLVRRRIIEREHLLAAYSSAGNAVKAQMINFYGDALSQMRLRSVEERVAFENELMSQIPGAEESILVRSGKTRFGRRRVNVFPARMRIVPPGVKHPSLGTLPDARVLMLLPDSTDIPEQVVYAQVALDSLAFVRYYVRDVAGKRSFVIVNQQSNAYPMTDRGRHENLRRTLQDWPWVLRMAIEYAARKHPKDEKGRPIEQIVSPPLGAVEEMWDKKPFLRMIYEDDIEQFGYRTVYLDDMLEFERGVEADKAWIKTLSPDDPEAALLENFFSPYPAAPAAEPQGSRAVTPRSVARQLKIYSQVAVFAAFGRRIVYRSPVARSPYNDPAAAWILHWGTVLTGRRFAIAEHVSDPTMIELVAVRDKEAPLPEASEDFVMLGLLPRRITGESRWEILKRMDSMFRRLPRVMLKNIERYDRRGTEPRFLSIDDVLSEYGPGAQRQAIRASRLIERALQLAPQIAEENPDLFPEGPNRIAERMKIAGLFPETTMLVPTDTAVYRWGTLRNSRTGRPLVMISVPYFAVMSADNPDDVRWAAFILMYGWEWHRRYTDKSPGGVSNAEAMRRFGIETERAERKYRTVSIRKRHQSIFAADTRRSERTRASLFNEINVFESGYLDLMDKLRDAYPYDPRRIIAAEQRGAEVTDALKNLALQENLRAIVYEFDKKADELAQRATASGDYSSALRVNRMANDLLAAYAQIDVGQLPMSRYVHWLRTLLRGGDYAEFLKSLHDLRRGILPLGQGRKLAMMPQEKMIFLGTAYSARFEEKMADIFDRHLTFLETVSGRETMREVRAEAFRLWADIKQVYSSPGVSGSRFADIAQQFTDDMTNPDRVDAIVHPQLKKGFLISVEKNELSYDIVMTDDSIDITIESAVYDEPVSIVVPKNDAYFKEAADALTGAVLIGFLKAGAGISATVAPEANDAYDHLVRTSIGDFVIQERIQLSAATPKSTELARVIGAPRSAGIVFNIRSPMMSKGASGMFLDPSHRLYDWFSFYAAYARAEIMAVHARRQLQGDLHDVFRAVVTLGEAYHWLEYAAEISYVSQRWAERLAEARSRVNRSTAISAERRVDLVLEEAREHDGYDRWWGLYEFTAEAIGEIEHDTLDDPERRQRRIDRMNTIQAEARFHLENPPAGPGTASTGSRADSDYQRLRRLMHRVEALIRRSDRKKGHDREILLHHAEKRLTQYLQGHPGSTEAHRALVRVKKRNADVFYRAGLQSERKSDFWLKQSRLTRAAKHAKIAASLYRTAYEMRYNLTNRADGAAQVYFKAAERTHKFYKKVERAQRDLHYNVYALLHEDLTMPEHARMLDEAAKTMSVRYLSQAGELPDGTQAIFADYAAFLRRHPGNPLDAWYAAVRREAREFVAENPLVRGPVLGTGIDWGSIRGVHEVDDDVVRNYFREAGLLNPTIRKAVAELHDTISDPKTPRVRRSMALHILEQLIKFGPARIALIRYRTQGRTPADHIEEAAARGARTVVREAGEGKTVEFFVSTKTQTLRLDEMKIETIVLPANNHFRQEAGIPRWAGDGNLVDHYAALYPPRLKKERHVGEVVPVELLSAYPRTVIHAVNRYVADEEEAAMSSNVAITNLAIAVWAALEEAEKLGLRSVAIPDSIAGTFPKIGGLSLIAQTAARFLRQPGVRMERVVVPVRDDEILERSESSIDEAVAMPPLAAVNDFRQAGLAGWDAVDELLHRRLTRNSSFTFESLIIAMSAARHEARRQRWSPERLTQHVEALTRYYTIGLSKPETEFIRFVIEGIGGQFSDKPVRVEEVLRDVAHANKRFEAALAPDGAPVSWQHGSGNVKARILIRKRFGNTYDIHFVPVWEENEKALYGPILNSSKNNYPNVFQGSVGRVVAHVMAVDGEPAIVFDENQTTEASHRLPKEVYARFSDRWIRATQEYAIAKVMSTGVFRAYAYTPRSVKILNNYDEGQIRQEKRMYHEPYADLEKPSPHMIFKNGVPTMVEMHRYPDSHAVSPLDRYRTFGPLFAGFSEFEPEAPNGIQMKPASRKASAVVRFDRPAPAPLLRAALDYGDPARNVRWQSVEIVPAEIGDGAYRLNFKIPKNTPAYTLRVSVDGGVTWAGMDSSIRVVSESDIGLAEPLLTPDAPLPSMADALPTQGILQNASAKIVGARAPERERFAYAVDAAQALWAEREGGAVEFVSASGQTARLVPGANEVGEARGAQKTAEPAAAAEDAASDAAAREIAARLEAEAAMLRSDTHFVLLKYDAASFDAGAEGASAFMQYLSMLEAMQKRWERAGVQAAIDVQFTQKFATGTPEASAAGRIELQNADARRALERERAAGKSVIVVDLRDPRALDDATFERLSGAGHSVLAMEGAAQPASDGVAFIDVIGLSYDLVLSARQAAEGRLPNARMLNRLGASAEEGLLILSGKADRALVLRNPLSWTLRLDLDDLLLVARRAIEMLETSK